jgi:hypothetical protein
VALGISQWFEFTTGPLPPDVPRVLRTWPADGAVAVPLNASVGVEFTIDMDEASMRSEFTILPPPLVGSYSTSPRWVVLSQINAIAPGTDYTGHVNGSVRSAAGVAMGVDFDFRFRTAGPPTYPVTGKVTDENGSPVPGATVEARKAIDDSLVATATTDSSGNYRLHLPVGETYYLVVKYPDGSSERSPTFSHDSPRSQSFQETGGGPGGNMAVIIAAGTSASLLVATLILLLAMRSRRSKRLARAPEHPPASTEPDEETMRAAKELEVRAKRAEATQRAAERRRERGGEG